MLECTDLEWTTDFIVLMYYIAYYIIYVLSIYLSLVFYVEEGILNRKAEVRFLLALALLIMSTFFSFYGTCWNQIYLGNCLSNTEILLNCDI